MTMSIYVAGALQNIEVSLSGT